MTSEEMREHFKSKADEAVMINGRDYTYHGWLVDVFQKRKSKDWRCVIEDRHGRLFIHNAHQLAISSERRT